MNLKTLKSLIDQSTIKCDNCKKEDKGHTENNKFYCCFNCKLNLCPKCKNEHDKQKHFIVNYEDKDIYCQTHNTILNSYCFDCEKDICALCENQHEGHEIKKYQEILPNTNISKKELEKLNDTIRLLRKDIKRIIAELNFVIDNLNTYYNIYKNIITNFNPEKINYLQIQNILDLQKYNCYFISKMTEITNDNNIKNKFKDLIEFAEKIGFTPKEKAGLKKNKDKTNKNIDDSNKDDLIEEENYIKNMARYNPSDDKYENFDVTNLKRIKGFEIKYDAKFIQILHDSRLLVLQNYKNEKGDTISKVCIYDLSDSAICDINYDSDKPICEIFQMSDDNIIITGVFAINIFKIKKKYLEEIKSVGINGSENIFKIFIDKILVVGWDHYGQIYSYRNNRLIESEYISIDPDELITIKNICSVNKKNIIAIYFTKSGMVYGKNAFIRFFDIKENKKIQTLKLGGYYDTGVKMLLFDENNLIVEYNYKLLLIDPKNITIKNELNHKKEKDFIDLILLNNKIILATTK